MNAATSPKLDVQRQQVIWHSRIEALGKSQPVAWFNSGQFRVVWVQEGTLALYDHRTVPPMQHLAQHKRHKHHDAIAQVLGWLRVLSSGGTL